MRMLMRMMKSRLLSAKMFKKMGTFRIVLKKYILIDQAQHIANNKNFKATPKE